jgi:hypothetical protein
LKNALAYYNAGFVAVDSKVEELAPKLSKIWYFLRALEWKR